MDCVNHTGVNATAYCQNCGKALCAECVRNAVGGQVLCEPCLQAWQGYQAPFVAAPPPGSAASAVAWVEDEAGRPDLEFPYRSAGVFDYASLFGDSPGGYDYVSPHLPVGGGFKGAACGAFPARCRRSVGP